MPANDEPDKKELDLDSDDGGIESVEDSKIDVRLIQNALRTRMNELAQAESEAAGGDKQATKKLSSAVARFTAMLENLQDHPERAVRDEFRRVIERTVVEGHLKYLREGENLPDSFLEERNRLAFRKDVYNSLCAEGMFGLSIRDMLRGPRVSAQYEKMKKKLGKKFSLFERICEQYDGHNFRATLEGLVDDVSKGDSAYLGRVRERAAGRAGIGMEAAARVQKKLAAGISGSGVNGRWLTFLREGGDLALKVAGAGLMIQGSGLVALGGLGLYAARGITEAAGFDFGKIVSKGFKGVKNNAKLSGKKLLSRMTQKWQDDMDPELRSWLQRAPEMSSEELTRASLSFKNRLKILGRGMLPFGNLIKANAEQNVGGQIDTQTHEAEQRLHEICGSALKKYKSSDPLSRSTGQKKRPQTRK